MDRRNSAEVFGVEEDYLNNALDELIGTFGVSEEIFLNYRPITKAQSKDAKRVIEEIAIEMGLPVKVDISFVPKRYAAGGGNRFESTQLSRTDKTGRGIEGITAQVHVPEHMPLYGSKELKGFIVKVRVSDNCLENPETFVAVMAHELSHVLLKSIRHPRWNDEIFTDIVPVVLGFGRSIREGRKVISYSTDRDVKIKHTTTYGYLSDTDFEMVYSRVSQLLGYYTLKRDTLSSTLRKLRKQSDSLRSKLQKLQEFIGYLSERRSARIRKQDSTRIVELHSLDYKSNIEFQIDSYKKTLDRIESFVKSLNCYTDSAVTEMQECSNTLASIKEKLDNLSQTTKDDLRILKRNMSFKRRVKHILSGF